MKNLKSMIVASAFAVMSAGSAQAALVTLDFSGNLTSALGSFTVGTGFSGNLTYDTDATVINAACTNDCQYVTPHLFTLQMGGDTVTSTGPGSNRVRVRDDFGANEFDSIQFNTNHDITGTLSGFELASILILLQDSDGTVFSSATLPALFPDLSEFEVRNVTFTYYPNPDDKSSTQQATGTITTLTQRNGAPNGSEIPAPAALGLLGIGLIALGFARRRRLV